MKIVYLRNIRKVKENLSLLQKSIGVNLSVNGNEVTISGDETAIYDADRILRAIEVGFSVDDALLLTDISFLFEEIRIKDLVKRRNLSEVRARIIGTQGKTKKTIQGLSDCILKIKDNSVYIIGTTEYIANARTALSKLIHGSKQGKVYAFLEKNRSKHKRQNKNNKL